MRKIEDDVDNKSEITIWKILNYKLRLQEIELNEEEESMWTSEINILVHNKQTLVLSLYTCT